MQIDNIVIIWDKDGKFCQLYRYKGSALTHAKETAKKIGGTYSTTIGIERIKP